MLDSLNITKYLMSEDYNELLKSTYDSNENINKNFSFITFKNMVNENLSKFNDKYMVYIMKNSVKSPFQRFDLLIPITTIGNGYENTLCIQPFLRGYFNYEPYDLYSVNIYPYNYYHKT